MFQKCETMMDQQQKILRILNIYVCTLWGWEIFPYSWTDNFIHHSNVYKVVFLKNVTINTYSVAIVISITEINSWFLVKQVKNWTVCFFGCRARNFVREYDTALFSHSHRQTYNNKHGHSCKNNCEEIRWFFFLELVIL